MGMKRFIPERVLHRTLLPVVRIVDLRWRCRGGQKPGSHGPLKDRLLFKGYDKRDIGRHNYKRKPITKGDHHLMKLVIKTALLTGRSSALGELRIGVRCIAGHKVAVWMKRHHEA